MASSIVRALGQFFDPQSETQLKALDAAVLAIKPEECGEAEFRAMLHIFERFPEDDGFGIFWGLVHALEACSGYESEMLASVARKPCEFNVLLVKRLLNAGITEVDGISLEGVLSTVLGSDAATPGARHDAERFIARSRRANEVQPFAKR